MSLEKENKPTQATFLEIVFKIFTSNTYYFQDEIFKMSPLGVVLNALCIYFYEYSNPNKIVSSGVTV